MGDSIPDEICSECAQSSDRQRQTLRSRYVRDLQSHKLTKSEYKLCPWRSKYCESGHVSG